MRTEVSVWLAGIDERFLWLVLFRFIRHVFSYFLGDCVGAGEVWVGDEGGFFVGKLLCFWGPAGLGLGLLLGVAFGWDL